MNKRMTEEEFQDVAETTLRLTIFPYGGDEPDPEPRALIAEAMRARASETDLNAQLDALTDIVLGLFWGGGRE